MFEHIQTKFESLYSLPNEKLYKYVIQPLRKQTKENKHIQSSFFQKGFKWKQSDIQPSNLRNFVELERQRNQ